MQTSLKTLLQVKWYGFIHCMGAKSRRSTNISIFIKIMALKWLNGQLPVNIVYMNVLQFFFHFTGRSWAAATTEGLLIFSLDGSLVFQPEDLAMEITPQKILQLSKKKDHSLALSYAFRLNEDELLKQVVENISIEDGKSNHLVFYYVR